MKKKDISVQTAEKTNSKLEIKKKGFEIPPAARAMAKSLGLDVDAMAKGAAENAARLENLEKTVVAIATQVDASDKKLAPLLTAIEQAQAARSQAATTAGGNPMPQGGGSGGIGLVDVLRLLGGGGGGGMDEEMLKLNKQMMQMTIDRMKSDIGFTEAIKNAMVTRIAGKAAADLAV